MVTLAVGDTKAWAKVSCHWMIGSTNQGPILLVTHLTVNTVWNLSFSCYCACGVTPFTGCPKKTHIFKTTHPNRTRFSA